MSNEIQCINTNSLDSKSKDIAEQILNEEDVDKVKDLTALFNMNSQKRNVIRVLKMNNLLDKVTDQMVERFEKNPHNFSNEDLLKYMQATETAIERANKNLNLIEETPPIQLTQNNQVNINVDQPLLNRESRDKVIKTVQLVLNNINNKDIEPIEVTATEIDD